jgi:hypothetical protein
MGLLRINEQASGDTVSAQPLIEINIRNGLEIAPLDCKV